MGLLRGSLFKFLLLLFTGEFALFSRCEGECKSKIYCGGKFLRSIQTHRLFEDSKTFVDMKMLKSEAEILRSFDDFMSAHRNQPLRPALHKWVGENFGGVGLEFEEWEPDDWVEEPKIVRNITEPTYRRWFLILNEIWLSLGRRIKKEVSRNISNYSILYVRNPFVVPGGRFREYYYWDSYWIVLGLLACDMNSTARGMLENFVDLVEEYGHVPNGGRLYYVGRSQPPFLIPMVKLYFDRTGDTHFLDQHISSLEKEFHYWIDEHSRVLSKGGRDYVVCTYGHRAVEPRPESYNEDLAYSRYFAGQKEKEEFFSEVRAAAESGWDFSSRWFVKNISNRGNMLDTKARSIVPVDLNALMCGNAMTLSHFHKLLGNRRTSGIYEAKARERSEILEKILWNEEAGIWLDYDSANSRARNYFYISNAFPLWTGCYDRNNAEIARSVVKYLKDNGVLFPGGVPASLEYTGEKWDYPYAWPPLEHILVVGLSESGVPEAVDFAKDVALRWMRLNYRTFEAAENMYEKYDVTRTTSSTVESEFDTQIGYGWSNGVILDFLSRYGVVGNDYVPNFDDGDDKGEHDENNCDSSIKTHFPVITFLCFIVS